VNHPTPAFSFDPIPERTEEDLLDELDSLVDQASRGDTRAVGVIAIAFGPRLLAEVHDVLGEDGSQDAADVLQDFFIALCRQALCFPAIRGAALPWMKSRVRARAANHRLRCVPPDEAAQ
jgi:DNA-directed RNA polymerase specialized sigma24 family protein